MSQMLEQRIIREDDTLLGPPIKKVRTKAPDNKVCVRWTKKLKKDTVCTSSSEIVGNVHISWPGAVFRGGQMLSKVMPLAKKVCKRL